MGDLKRGDLFRLTEPGDKEPMGTFVASEDAHQVDGVWGVMVEIPKGKDRG